MPDVHIKNVSFTYPGLSKPVLKKLNLTIHEGEFVLLAGPSGCGKSTLALALAGLIPARIAGRWSGSIYLGNENLSSLDIHEIAQNIGMVFQNPNNQLIHLDVEAEVAFGPENLALPRSEILQRVNQGLAYTGMEQHRTQEIFALSGGQKQRVAIAATLAMRPKVLVLDEPTSDLDPVGTQEVLGVLRMLNKQYGMTIVLIEHKIDEVIPWVDRVLLMDQGRIVVDSPPRQAFDDTQRWDNPGVSVPQMVRLARALPDVFRGSTPLSVDEVYEELHNTHFAQSLLQRAQLDKHSYKTNALISASTSESLVSWQGVGLAYGENRVLRDINAQVMPEEWVAIIGPNGSGKTSLASLAMGFQPPTTGAVYYKGNIVRTGQISRQAERMSYLFQDADTMLFGATVEQEFLFGSKHRRKQPADLSVSIDQLLQTTDLTNYRQSNPFQLSHGQRKRLALGALLTRRPDILLLDEPTTGQDEGHANTFLQFLQQLRKHEKLTYAMITHDMRAVADYASRVIVLRAGHVFMDGTPETIFARIDELAQCNVLPPPIAQLHARLCQSQATHVALNVSQFLQALQPVEVTL